MSDAIADGNQILGSIAATAVFQNENCTPVFVPNSPSLSYLFKSVMQQAGLDPRSISVVECHGTGTPVGDPAEYEVRPGHDVYFTSTYYLLPMPYALWPWSPVGA